MTAGPERSGLGTVVAQTPSARTVAMSRRRRAASSAPASASFRTRSGGVRQQRDADAGPGEREAAAHPVPDRCRVPCRQALHENGLVAVAHGEEDVLAGGPVQFLRERQRGGAQSVAAGRQRGDLEQLQADDESTVVEAFEGAHGRQLGRDPGRGALRKARPGGERVERQTLSGLCEGSQDPEGPLQAAPTSAC